MDPSSQEIAPLKAENLSSSAALVPPFPKLEMLHPSPVTFDQVRMALSRVEDPELHVDVLTLELIYRIRLDGNKVNILTTLTTPACPYGPLLIDMMRSAIMQLSPELKEVKVEVTFEPLWQPSDDLKAMMGLL
jgi:metal-sulfur cluster biosynthetic enzyme